MSAEHWQERWNIGEYALPIAEVVRALPTMVWDMRLAHAGDTSIEDAARRIYERLDSIFTAAWGDE